MEFPLYVICHFPLVVFNFISVFNFCQFDFCVSQCVPPWVYPSWDFLGFLNLVDCFLSHVFSYYLFKYFLKSFLSFSWGPYNANIRMFNVVAEISWAVFISFHSFFCILFCNSDFHHSVLQVIYPCLCLSYSAAEFS